MSEVALARRCSRETAALVLLGALGAVMVALAATCVAAYGPWGSERTLVAIFLLWGVLVVFACRAAVEAPTQRALWVIISVAILLRLIGLLHEPLLSSDVYRYIWDGRVQAAGINPYRYIPTDEALRALRDGAIFSNINRANYAPTVYPPVAQMFFFLVTRISESTVALRIALVLCEAAIVTSLWDLLRSSGRPVTLIAAYAWHPLAAWEISNSGHVEALMVALFMAGGWLLIRARRTLGAVAIALAALVKPYALLALPTFWRRWDWRVPLAAAAGIALCYLPYLSAGTAAVGFLPQYTAEEGMRSGDAFWPVLAIRRLIGDVPGLLAVYLLVAAGTLGWLALSASFRPASTPEQSLRDTPLLMMAGLFFLSPNYPWYYLVLVPLIPLGGGAPAWTLTILAPLLYLWWTPGNDPRLFLWKSVLNVAFLAALLLSAKPGLLRLGGSRS